MDVLLVQVQAHTHPKVEQRALVLWPLEELQAANDLEPSTCTSTELHAHVARGAAAEWQVARRGGGGATPAATLLPFHRVTAPVRCRPPAACWRGTGR